MNKLIALMNVIAWSGFWAFGYIALTDTGEMTSQRVLIAAALAGAGFLTGMFTYIRLSNTYTPKPPVPKEDN
ncbi:hypothetical protein [Rhodalgimonas zhirmunskyi]|uniref:Uncharacterized protein n=1 Tax=Rhodalgimonas zhirmunskyi TaxID=2964767 RepID=A0AAJ1UAV7_9RHOB|nr:hypothetical protein [Rhodoalgimonas zhirmunskyi]MDQ2095100.1 hypothetical protein [Rhodoalgimonas zhirmunskyi]